MIYLCVDILSVSIFYLHACNYSQDGDFVCYDSYNYRYVQGALKEKDWSGSNWNNGKKNRPELHQVQKHSNVNLFLLLLLLLLSKTYLNALATRLKAFFNIFLPTNRHTDTKALLYPCCTCVHGVTTLEFYNGREHVCGTWCVWDMIWVWMCEGIVLLTRPRTSQHVTACSVIAWEGKCLVTLDHFAGMNGMWWCYKNSRQECITHIWVD